MWKKIAIAAITGELDKKGASWDTISLACPAFKCGEGSDLLTGSTHTIGSFYSPVGAEILSLMGRHEIVILQHAPPRGFIEDLLKAGVQQVLIWCDFECIPATKYWSKRQLGVYNALVPFKLLSSTKNRFGSTFVDPYEASAGGAEEKPHCHYIRTWGDGRQDVATKFAQAVGTMFEENYRGLPVGVFLDNCLDRPYFGTATNAPILSQQSQDEYKTTWQEAIGNLRKLNIGPIYGNCAGRLTHYPQLDGKMDELVFVPPVTTDQAADVAKFSILSGEVARRGMRQEYAYNVATFGAAGKWAIDQELWSQVNKKLAQDIDLDKICVVTAWTGKWLFHPGQSIANF